MGLSICLCDPKLDGEFDRHLDKCLDCRFYNHCYQIDDNNHEIDIYLNRCLDNLENLRNKKFEEGSIEWDELLECEVDLIMAKHKIDETRATMKAFRKV